MIAPPTSFTLILMLPDALPTIFFFRICVSLSRDTVR
jgi:hypothetical protein